MLSKDIAPAICEALGIDLEGTTSVTITLAHDDVVRVVVERLPGRDELIRIAEAMRPLDMSDNLVIETTNLEDRLYRNYTAVKSE
ncbi:hypothetical protein D9M69_583100 [compost metagenome]